MSERKNMRHAPPECELLKRVREHLEATSIPYLEIYKATGVAPNRLWAIKSGKTPDPSVNTIVCLYEYLTGLKLVLVAPVVEAVQLRA